MSHTHFCAKLMLCYRKERAKLEARIAKKDDKAKKQHREHVQKHDRKRRLSDPEAHRAAQNLRKQKSRAARKATQTDAEKQACREKESADQRKRRARVCPWDAWIICIQGPFRNVLKSSRRRQRKDLTQTRWRAPLTASPSDIYLCHIIGSHIKCFLMSR